MSSVYVRISMISICILLFSCTAFADITVETLTKERQQKEQKLWDWFTVSIKPDKKSNTYRFEVTLKKGHNFSRSNESITLHVKDKNGKQIVSCSLCPKKLKSGQSVLHFTLRMDLASYTTLSFFSDDSEADVVNTYTWNVDLSSYTKGTSNKSGLGSRHAPPTSPQTLAQEMVAQEMVAYEI